MDSDRDRPHFRPSSSTAAAATAKSELFICFTSRLSSSSSSMKLTKSILSPGRAARDGGGPATLSSSLSRRLRTNGSIKGGASPFFTTTGKKRGCGFENPEPSSPKVTCIGQVRVKTKKKVKRSRSVSKRRAGSGEVSFRKIEQDGERQIEECRNQRWVHLPVSICEALRAEFSCLFPCKTSCFSTSEREEKGEKDENGCGAVFARWLVSVNDGEGGKRKEIELVVGGGDEEEEEERLSMRSSRRHVFEDIEVKDDRIELKGGQSMEEEGARVSICVPPKNALLLMRCRSDPMKMAALANANRFSWTAPKTEDIEEEEEVEDNNVEACKEEQVCNGDGEDEVFEEAHVLGEPNEVPDKAQSNLEVQVVELCPGDENIGEKEELAVSSEEMVEEQKGDEEEEETLQQQILWIEEKAALKEEEEEEEEELKEEEDDEREEVESNMSSFEDLLVQENTDNYQDCPIQQDKEEMQDGASPFCHLPPSTQTESESDDASESNNEPPPLLQEEEAATHKEIEEPSISTEKDAILLNNDLENNSNSELETTPHEDEEEEEVEEQSAMQATEPEAEEMVSSNQQMKQRPKVLPECLLLMMCEPKLSMEVSKETWVCSTDFIRWLPGKPPKPDNDPVKRRLSIDSKAVAHAPPRSSMAAMIEHKLVNAVAYEPFVLTRCKSEPMRTAAAKLMPESCFWKNAMRKLEPHSRGVGAAGIGF